MRWEGWWGMGYCKGWGVDVCSGVLNGLTPIFRFWYGWNMLFVAQNASLREFPHNLDHFKVPHFPKGISIQWLPPISRCLVPPPPPSRLRPRKPRKSRLHRSHPCLDSQHHAYLFGLCNQPRDRGQDRLHESLFQDRRKPAGPRGSLSPDIL